MTCLLRLPHTPTCQHPYTSNKNPERHQAGNESLINHINHCESAQHSGNYTGWHSPGAVVNKDAEGRNPTIFEKMPFPTGSCALLRTVTVLTLTVMVYRVQVLPVIVRPGEATKAPLLWMGLKTWQKMNVRPAYPSTFYHQKMQVTAPSLENIALIQQPNSLEPCSWTSYPPKLPREVCILITQLWVFHYHSTKILPQDWVVGRLWSLRMGKEVLSYSRHWEVPFQVPRMVVYSYKCQRWTDYVPSP